MRIAVVAGFGPSLLNFRGHLIKEMVAQGHEVFGLAPQIDSTVSAGLAALGATPVSYPLERTSRNPLKDLQTITELSRKFDRLRLDAVLAYTVKAVIYGSLAAKLSGVKSVYSMITGLGYAFSASSDASLLVRQFVKQMYRIVLASNRKVFFQNPDDLELFLKEGILQRRSRAVLVNGSGVDLDHFASTDPVDNPVTFLMIARLIRDKGVREYAAACAKIRARHPSVRCLLAGPIDLHPTAISPRELETWVSQGAIEYLGELQDVRAALDRCSVYVLPSYREGAPRTVLEAMSKGRPIITTDVPGCRQMVEPGENGFLVPHREVDPLVAAMEKYVADPRLIGTQGLRSRAIAEERFNVKDVNSQMLTYMGLKASRRSPVADLQTIS